MFDMLTGAVSIDFFLLIKTVRIFALFLNLLIDKISKINKNYDIVLHTSLSGLIRLHLIIVAISAKSLHLFVNSFIIRH